MRLSAASLEDLKKRGIETPAYALDQVETSVVHFGPGAFHRVHQAHYFDRLLTHDNRWGVCEVALQSTGVRDALEPQDGLYSLAVLDRESSVRIVGSAREFLVARESTDAILKKLSSPNTRLITATITEKGYCLNAEGGLQFSHPDIQHDLENPTRPKSFVGFVAEMLRRRYQQKLNAPVILSCDNLTDNGVRLRRAVLDFVESQDGMLASWVEAEVKFPRTMVDSITPATDDALRKRIAEQLGCEDAWPVQREAFTQWVIEEYDATESPDWQSVGVTVTQDVAGYENAKLRLLNGAHSSIAYLGSLAGIETVSQAMANSALAGFIRTLMTTDIAPTVKAPPELDKAQYIESLLLRFQNPVLHHKLAQIAWDGSQKISFRLLGTIGDALTQSRPLARLTLPIAAWFHFIRRKAHSNESAIDPLATQLRGIGSQCSGDAAGDVKRFLSLPLFADSLRARPEFVDSLVDAYARLENVRTAQDLKILQ